MLQFVYDRGIGIAWGALAMAAQVSGFTNTAIALFFIAVAAFFFVAPVFHHAHAWHKRRELAGQKSLEPVHLIIGGLVGIIIFATVALGGVFWHFNKNKSSNGESKVQIDDAALVAADAKNAELQSQLTATQKELADERQRRTEQPDTTRTKLLFRSEQIRVFKDEYDRRAAKVRELAEKALLATKQQALAPPNQGFPPTGSRLQGIWGSEVIALEKVCDDFFGEKTAIMPSEPTMQNLTSTVPGDNEIQDYDKKLQYRMFWLKQQQANLALNRIDDKTISEILSLNKKISEVK